MPSSDGYPLGATTLRSRLILPAVHRERRSRDQASIVGGEEYDRARSPLASRGGTREGITFSIKQAWRKQVRADLALLEVGQEDAVDAARQQPGKVSLAQAERQLSDVLGVAHQDIEGVELDLLVVECLQLHLLATVNLQQGFLIGIRFWDASPCDIPFFFSSSLSAPGRDVFVILAI